MKTFIRVAVPGNPFDFSQHCLFCISVFERHTCESIKIASMIVEVLDHLVVARMGIRLIQADPSEEGDQEECGADEMLFSHMASEDTANRVAFNCG